MLNEAVALATIIVNCSEKLISYRLQTEAPHLMHESNPLARITITRYGLLATHAAFSIVSVAIVCLTYIFSWASPVAGLCLWLELICSILVFLNNFRLSRRN